MSFPRRRTACVGRTCHVLYGHSHRPAWTPLPPPPVVSTPPLSPFPSSSLLAHSFGQLEYEAEASEEGSGAVDAYVALGLRFSNIGQGGGAEAAARMGVEARLRRYWAEMVCR